MIRKALILLSFTLAFTSGFFFGEYFAASSFPSVTVNAAAVTSDGEGVLIKISARLVPGSGRVLIASYPYTGIDLQSSAESAVFVAQTLTHPLLFRDIVFTIEGPAELVEGPSAGVAMAVAAYALLSGKKPRNDVVVTGYIDESGNIHQVSGLVSKLKACVGRGVRYFLIPYGQRYAYAPEVSEKKERFGNVTIVRRRTTWKRVDLKELGRNFGIEVVEVRTIDDVLPYFFR